jgi:hypothetical protein
MFVRNSDQALFHENDGYSQYVNGFGRLSRITKPTPQTLEKALEIYSKSQVTCLCVKQSYDEFSEDIHAKSTRNPCQTLN